MLHALAGGRNVFGAAGERYPEITAEDLARTSPELVLLSSEPFPFAGKHADELAELTGLPRDRFRHTIKLKQNIARPNGRYPIFGLPFALAHAGFRRARRHRAARPGHCVAARGRELEQ